MQIACNKSEIGHCCGLTYRSMPTYVYETIPPTPDLPARRFELRQSMRDAALTYDPETGHPVRRVPQASFYLGGVKRLAVAPLDGGGCCGPSGGACQH
jgi:predicted nucleic acid-binding Zn ribbon protein